MSKCILQGFGKCDSKMTGEHYISEVVLRQLTDGNGVQVGGLPWIPDGQLKDIGIGSLTAKILCKKHNEELSKLDSEAGKLFRALIAADKDRASMPDLTQVTGKLLERWLIKVLCGLTASAGFNGGTIPEQWKKLLVGGSWPPKWGLYIPTKPGQHVLANEFYVETAVNPETREVKAATFRLAGVHLNLLLGRPDEQKAWGEYRPRGIIFQYMHNAEKRIEIMWPHRSNKAVIYSKLADGTSDVPQWKDWKRPSPRS